MNTTKTSYGTKKQLAADNPRYLLVEHQIEKGMQFPFIANFDDNRSFIVLEGEVEVFFVLKNGELESQVYQSMDGWHSLAGGCFQIKITNGNHAVIVEAGSVEGDYLEINDISKVYYNLIPNPSYMPLSKYLVQKPWGDEVWYTENLESSSYALKKIRMNAGNQSSLQSHEKKLETNFVIQGAATVLAGVIAPEDLNAVIDISTLDKTVFNAGMGWTNKHRELHRVIAEKDYTAIEVSTPELDDVIRWQDDSNRNHGRIEKEHQNQ